MTRETAEVKRNGRVVTNPSQIPTAHPRRFIQYPADTTEMLVISPGTWSSHPGCTWGASDGMPSQDDACSHTGPHDGATGAIDVFPGLKDEITSHVFIRPTSSPVEPDVGRNGQGWVVGWVGGWLVGWLVGWVGEGQEGAPVSGTPSCTQRAAAR